MGASRALSKILIQLRVQGRNPARFNGGYGVPRGFKGEKSKFPPNPLGLAERVHRPQTMIPPRSPTPHSSCEFGFFFICFICFLCLVCLLCRGLRRSRPSALPSIAYRGFAVAPYDPSRVLSKILIQLRVQDIRKKFRRNIPLHLYGESISHSSALMRRMPS